MNVYWKAVSIGAVAGMRSMMAPAFTADYLMRKPSPAIDASPLRGFGLPVTAKALKFMALGELGGDKLPNTPNRTAPLPLMARAISGGLCGAALFMAEGERVEAGALIGALSAIASAFAFFTLRRTLTKSGRIPDYVSALAEDTFALRLGRTVFPSK